MLYPSDALTQPLPFSHVLVGARLKIQERHLPGLKAQLPAGSVFSLLRDDVRKRVRHFAKLAGPRSALVRP